MPFVVLCYRLGKLRDRSFEKQRIVPTVSTWLRLKLYGGGAGNAGYMQDHRRRHAAIPVAGSL